MTMHRSRSTWAVGFMGLAIALSVSSGEAWAHHDLRQEIGDLFGPNAWALHLIAFVPYALFGFLGYRIYRALRASTATKDRGKPDRGGTP